MEFEKWTEEHLNPTVNSIPNPTVTSLPSDPTPTHESPVPPPSAPLAGGSQESISNEGPAPLTERVSDESDPDLENIAPPSTIPA